MRQIRISTDPDGGFAQQSGAVAAPSASKIEPSAPVSTGPDLLQNNSIPIEVNLNPNSVVGRYNLRLKEINSELVLRYELSANPSSEIKTFKGRYQERDVVVKIYDIKDFEIQADWASDERFVQSQNAAKLEAAQRVDKYSKGEEENLKKCGLVFDPARTSLVQRFIEKINLSGDPNLPPYLNILEFVEGTPLSEVLNGKHVESWSESKAIDLLRGGLKSLAELHRGGVQHRDIKPGNIIISSEGEVKLIDINISSEAAHTSFTMVHDAKWQIRPANSFMGKGLTHDLYSLGAVVIGALLGKDPNLLRGEGDHVGYLDLKCLDKLNISRGLKKFLKSICAEKISKRPDDAIEALNKLEEILNRSSEGLWKKVFGGLFSRQHSKYLNINNPHNLKLPKEYNLKYLGNDKYEYTVPGTLIKIIEDFSKIKDINSKY